MIVIGSTALNYHIPGIRPPVDLDLVGTYDELTEFRKTFEATTFYPIAQGKKMFMRSRDGRIAEADIAWEGSAAERLRDFILADDGTHVEERRNGLTFVYPSLNVLYLLKMSHRYLKDSPHFLKTMRDIQLLRKYNAVIQEEHHPFYLKRMADTYTYNHPKLNVSKDNFFDAEATGVKYTYDHDSIHEAIKTLVVPTYQLFKNDEQEVMCNKELFFAAPEDVRIRAGMEEAMVLAIERSLVPFPGVLTPSEAFNLALMKVCTSITSGWFREYCWENYDKIQELFSFYSDYFEQFQKGLKSGVVKKFAGKEIKY
jgi:hypothetical protein